MVSGVLKGGSRRRGGAWRRLGLGLVVLAAAVIAALMLPVRGEDAARTPGAPAAGASGRAVEARIAANLPPAPGDLGTDVPPATAYASHLIAPAGRVRVRFKRPPRGAVLFDLDSGRVLWRRHATHVLPIASLTKMMTAILVVDALPARARVRITRQAVKTGGSKLGVLPKGRRLRLETLLNGLLIVSGNDAAVALAQRTAGTVPDFVKLMNARAGEMGLTCTRYAGPSGLIDRGNHSCARDLAALAHDVLRRKRLARIVRRRKVSLSFPIKGGRLELWNTNPLLRQRYPGVIGVKTGFTDAAGRCLVAVARRGPTRLGVVLLHSPDPARQARQLLDRGFKALG